MNQGGVVVVDGTEKLSRFLSAISAASIVVLLCGCGTLRLPRIDPTGSRIFAPGTTELTLPRLHGDRSGNGGFFPEPAFPTPATPPNCIQGVPAAPPTTILPPQVTVPPVVPAPCGDDCWNGPKAVLQDGSFCAAHSMNLPKQGKRGKMQLTPRRVIAPVGGEVLLLSGVCGKDGYLIPGEKIEWMLAPDGVGTIVQVGDDDRWLVHRLAGTEDPKKLDTDYAIGRTSTRGALITRGTRTPRDDVRLEKGETWLSLTSASEGVSRVTVLAPESECWDHRKATSTIYWIDAAWQCPENQIAAAGEPAQLVTRVTRSEGTIPATGWIVRYEILTPTLGTLGPELLSVVEVPVDANGDAPLIVNPVPGTQGTATVDIRIIRPAEEDLPRMTIARCAANVTWTAPALDLRASGPEVATIDQPFALIANLRNPGSLPTQDVKVTMTLPSSGVDYLQSEFIGGGAAIPGDPQQVGNQVIWELPPIPAGQQIDLRIQMTARETFQAVFTAQDAGGLVANDSVNVNVFQPSLDIQARPVDERVEVGDIAEFEIDVVNTGTRALQSVSVVATGSPSITHLERGRPQVSVDKPDPLAPGESWPIRVRFQVNAPGQQCVTFQANAAGGQRASTQACVIGTNPPVPTPSLVSTIQANRAEQVGGQLRATPEQPITVGDQVLAEYRLSNDGQIDLTNLRVVATYDRALELVQATDGYDQQALTRYQIVWYIPRLEAGSYRVLQAAFRALDEGETSLVLAVENDQNAQADDLRTITVLPATGTPRFEAPPLADPGPPGPTPTVPSESFGQPTPPPTEPDPTPPPRVEDPTAGQLALRITDRRDPAQVGDEIPYSILVKNERGVIDQDLEIRIEAPADVKLLRVRRAAGMGDVNWRTIADGIYVLSPIATLRAGEDLRFEVILQPSLPQQMQVRVIATSRYARDGVAATENTTVNP